MSDHACEPRRARARGAMGASSLAARDDQDGAELAGDRRIGAGCVPHSFRLAEARSRGTYMAAPGAKKRRVDVPAPIVVSVCLPVHNCEQYLDDCFASILGAYTCKLVGHMYRYSLLFYC